MTIVHTRGARRSSRSAAATALALILVLAAPGPARGQVRHDVEASRRLVREAVAARERGDVSLFRAKLDSAVAFRDDHPGLVYALAAAEAEAGWTARALGLLERLAGWGYAEDPGADERFASLADDARFRRARQGLLSNVEPVGSATVAFRLTDHLTLPEGLGYDPLRRSLVLTGVHRRSVSLVDEEGAEHILVDGRADGLGAPLGLAVDPDRRRLWVSSARLPEADTSGAAATDGAVREYDLDSGRVLREVHLPAESAASPGDLALDGEGGVYVSDWRSGSLLRIRHGSTTFAEVLPPGTLGSPQGLVLGADGRTAWVADYALGLVLVDLVARTATRMEAPGTTLIGSDALLGRGPDLVVVQNGFRPARVLRLHLDGAAIADVSVLLSAHEAFDEPTGATIVADTLFLVANSQWGAFAEGAMPDVSAVEPPIILAVPLMDGR